MTDKKTGFTDMEINAFASASALDEAEAVHAARIADVKHFVVTKDADGNEVRTEVTEENVKKDFSDVI